jgi:hypothetical protein
LAIDLVSALNAIPAPAGDRVGHRSLTADAPTRRGIEFPSIQAFKGLGSPVVILFELEDLDDVTCKQQLYFGLSPARNHYVIVAPAGP